MKLGWIHSLWLLTPSWLLEMSLEERIKENAFILTNIITHLNEVKIDFPMRARHFCLCQSPPDYYLMRKWDLVIPGLQKIICHACSLEICQQLTVMPQIKVPTHTPN